MTATLQRHDLDPSDLAERLSAGPPVTILDVRDDASWTIEAPTATVLHVPAAVALAGTPQVAAQLDGEVVVVCNRGITAQGVAEALRADGVDAVVLRGGMRGWLGVLVAHPVETALPGVDVVQVQRPGRGCLSYVIVSGGEALVVDPAPDAPFYADVAARLGARVTTVVDTHLHADHLSGARDLASLTGATYLLPSPAVERGIAFASEVGTLDDGERLDVGGLEVVARALPGHTTDMTGLLLGGRVLVAGDSLFADGIARPDLQHGDPEGSRAMARTLHVTISERILTLGDDVLLLPCHTHPGVASEAVVATLAEVRAAVPELAYGDPDRFAGEVLAAMPPRPANYEAIIGANAGFHGSDPELEAGGNSCSSR